MDAQITTPEESPHWNLVFNPLEITLDVLNYNYRGTGLGTDPYIVEFIPGDWRNPVSFALWKKWLITITLAFGTLAVTFTSSSYSGGIVEILTEFDINAELSTAGISLFVLGFAVGPLFWAPLSELYGRQIVFFCTFAALTFFNAGAAASQNIYTLLILRFFAGSFGSSVLTNAGGVIADMFPASERGLATSVFAAAPFLGPSIGPLVGGFVAQSVGWRWVEGVSAIFTGVLWIVGAITIPETYSPVILQRRAQKLSRMTGKTYKSAIEIEQGTKTTSQAFRTALVRPWVLLCTEPIVLLLSIYVAIIYGTLYMMFGAFPIVYQRVRGWSEGLGGLSFLGVAVGIIIAVILTIPDNNRYNRAASRCNGSAPPEARLPPAILGSIFIPVGLFWFAWTNGPDVHWSVAIIGTAFFGFGMVLVFLSTINYLVDAYVIYAASVLAANSVLRSLFGAIFPLFTTYMYNGLGIHWASSIPAFLALSCVPFPFLFYRYGAYIRSRCKFATHAAKILEEIRAANFSSDRDAISPTRIRDGSLEAQDEK